MSDIEETDEVLVYVVTTQAELTGTSGGIVGDGGISDVFMAGLTETKVTDLLVASVTETMAANVAESMAADVLMTDVRETTREDVLVAGVIETTSVNVADTTKEHMSDVTVTTVAGTTKRMSNVNVTTVAGKKRPMLDVAVTNLTGTKKPMLDVPVTTLAGKIRPLVDVTVTTVAETKEPMSDVTVAEKKELFSDFTVTTVTGKKEHISDVAVTTVAEKKEPMSDFTVTAVAETKELLSDVTVTTVAEKKELFSDFTAPTVAETKEPMSDFTVTSVTETKEPLSDFTVTTVAETKEPVSDVTVTTVAETKEPMPVFTVTTAAETKEPMPVFTVTSVTETKEPMSDFTLSTSRETKESATSNVTEETLLAGFIEAVKTANENKRAHGNAMKVRGGAKSTVINLTDTDMADGMETTAVDISEINHMGMINSSLIDLTKTEEAHESMELGKATTTQDDLTITADVGKGIATTTWAGAIKFKVMGLSKTEKSGLSKTEKSGWSKTEKSGWSKTEKSGWSKTEKSGWVKTEKSGVNKTKLSDFTNNAADSGLLDKHLMIDLTETEDEHVTEDLTETEDVDVTEVAELVSRVSNVTRNREPGGTVIVADATYIERDESSMMDESASQGDESFVMDETSAHSDNLLMIDETTTHSDDSIMMNETTTQKDDSIKINATLKKPMKKKDKAALIRQKTFPEQLKYIMTFQREFPITLGYVARLLLSGMSPRETGEELKSYIDSLNLSASLHTTSFYASIYNFPQRLKNLRYAYVQKWDQFRHKMSEPFPITFLADVSEDKSTLDMTPAQPSDQSISVLDPASASIQSTLTLSPKKGLHSYQMQLRRKLKVKYDFFPTKNKMKIPSSLVQTESVNNLSLASVDASVAINPSSSSAEEAQLNQTSSSSIQTTPTLNQTSQLKTAPTKKIDKHVLNLNELKKYIMSFKFDYPMKNGYVAKLLLSEGSVDFVADEIISCVSSLNVPVIIHREQLIEGICQVYSKYKEMEGDLFTDWSEFDSFLNLPFTLPVQLSSEAGQCVQKEATIFKLNNEVASLKRRVMNYRSKKEEKKKSMATLINQMQEKINRKNKRIDFWKIKYQKLLDLCELYKLQKESLEVDKDNSSQLNKLFSNVSSLEDTRKGPVEGTSCLSTSVCGQDEQQNPGVKVNQAQHNLSLRKCIYNCLVHNVPPGKCQELLKFTAETLFNTHLAKLGNRNEDWARELSLLSSLQLGHTLHWQCEAMTVEMSAVVFEGRSASQIQVKASPSGHKLFIDFLATPEITARECNEFVRETFLKAIKEYIHACHLPEATATDVLMNKVKSTMILHDAVTKNSASISLNKQMGHNPVNSLSSFDPLQTLEKSAKSALAKLDKTWLVFGSDLSACPVKMCLLLKLIRNIQTFRFSSALGDPVGFESILKGLKLPVSDFDAKSNNDNKQLLFQQSTIIHSIKGPLLQFMSRFRKKPLADEIVQTLRNPLMQIQLHCVGLFSRFLVEPWSRELNKVSGDQEVRATFLKKSIAMLTRVIKEPDLMFTMLVDTFGKPYGQDVFSLQDAQAQGMLFLHNVRKYSECIVQLATAFSQSLQGFLTRPGEYPLDEAASAPADEDGSENIYGTPTEEMGLLGWKSRAVFNKTIEWLCGLDPLVQEQYITYAIQQAPKVQMENSWPAEAGSPEEAGSLETESCSEEEPCTEAVGRDRKERLEALIAEELRTNEDVLSLPCFRTLVQSDKDKLRRFLQDDNALSGCVLEHLRAENGQDVMFFELVVCVSNLSESNAADSQVFLYYWKQGEDRSDSVISLPMPKFLTDFAVGDLKFSADSIY